jgi:glycosyltransferase involved in cell wall biosynthesis/peroxiredoxin/predicted 2-oxoglutarate/Fe(II)-dependent dioxygenase YbiX
MLTVGDPAPWFTIPSTSNPSYHFDTVGGYRTILFFFGSSKIPGVAELLKDFLQRQIQFSELNVPFFGVSVDPEDAALKEAIEYPSFFKFLWDFEQQVSQQYGVCQPEGQNTYYAPTVFIIDESLHVLHILPVENSEQYVSQVMAIVEALPELEPHSIASRQAPALFIPKVFEPELCQQLIRLYETNGGEESGFMREVDGKTVAIMDYSFKKRRDFLIEDQALLERINERVLRRIKPEIEKAFQFEITRFERHLIACYEAHNQGFFNRHRDNTTKGTAHRRFAMTLNLNTGEYEGGCLWFPEYGRQLYRPGAGEAVIFSCSMLHEVTPVTAGQRYALLSFFYGDEDAQIREQNRKYLAAKQAAAKKPLNEPAAEPREATHEQANQVASSAPFPTVEENTEAAKKNEVLQESAPPRLNPTGEGETPPSDSPPSDAFDSSTDDSSTNRSGEANANASSDLSSDLEQIMVEPSLAQPAAKEMPAVKESPAVGGSSETKSAGLGFQPRQKAKQVKRSKNPTKILFLHPNFPAQFRHLATNLATDPNYQIVYGTSREEGAIAGVQKVLYAPSRDPHPETHHYIRSLENAVLQGQAVYRIVQQLKDEGFVPDVVYGHSGWGPTLFIKDALPKAKLLCYFEWFYNAHGSDSDFDPANPLTPDDEARIRIKNSPILLDLYSCDQGLTPTQWQQQQFPSEFRSKLKVLHDGVDTDFFQPKPGAKLVLPSLGIDLSEVDELVTYVARGMEPYRGFPQFLQAVSLLQKRRPNCHVVIVGEDRVAYGRELPNGKTYKQLMLEQLPLDLARLHFTGYLPYSDHLKVLQASSVHVYLTYPFVLSWSMLEAMATGCLVLGSDTPPVREMIRDGENGLLVDFFKPDRITDRICEILDHPDRMATLRQKARETILDSYRLSDLLPQHLAWVKEWIRK